MEKRYPSELCPCLGNAMANSSCNSIRKNHTRTGFPCRTTTPLHGNHFQLQTSMYCERSRDPGSLLCSRSGCPSTARWPHEAEPAAPSAPRPDKERPASDAGRLHAARQKRLKALPASTREHPEEHPAAGPGTQRGTESPGRPPQGSAHRGRAPAARCERRGAAMGSASGSR